MKESQGRAKVNMKQNQSQSKAEPTRVEGRSDKTTSDHEGKANLGKLSALALGVREKAHALLGWRRSW